MRNPHELTSKLVLVVLALAMIGATTIIPALAIKNPPYTDLTAASVVDFQIGIFKVRYSVTTAGDILLTADGYIKSKKLFGYACIGDPQIRDATVVTFDRVPRTTSSWDAHTYSLKTHTDPEERTHLCLVGVEDPNQRTVSVVGNTLTAKQNRADVSVTGYI